MNIEPMFDEDGLRGAILADIAFLGEPISDTLADAIVENARLYYREALGKFAEAFLKQASDKLTGEIATILVDATRTQRVVPPKPDATPEW